MDPTFARAPVSAPLLIGRMILVPYGMHGRALDAAVAHELAHYQLGHGLASYLRIVGAHRLARRQEWREEAEARRYAVQMWPELFREREAA